MQVLCRGIARVVPWAQFQTERQQVKFKSSLLAQASGSVGGSTYSRNKGGMYIRNRAVPTNPNTAEQQVVRNALTSLSQLWVQTLTQAQRDAWQVYAEQVPITNSLGDARPIPPLAMYIRCNVARLQASLTRVDNAPVIFDLGGFTSPVLTVTAATNLVSVAFTNTDGWATAIGGAMIVKASRPMNQSIQYFKGPYRYAGKISGAATPPTSPAALALPFPVAVGALVAFEVTAAFPDGRYSAPLRFQQTAV